MSRILGIGLAVVLAIDQLDPLARKMGEVADAIHKKDSDALLANGRFLEEKFGPSTLALPQSS